MKGVSIPGAGVVLCACLAFLSVAERGYSQYTGTLSGTVKDATASVVGHAAVTLIDGQTSPPRQTTTNATGEYAFHSVLPGDYTLRVAVAGFRTFEKTLHIASGRTTALEISLELEKTTEHVSVEGRIDPYEVVPNQPTDSLFGFGKRLEEIPRSISVVESQTMLRYDVRTVNDLVTVAPGSFTGSYFGVPGSLFIRGEPGDNFFRGFRRVENRGNYQTPVAATDHIEIVKGPPSPIYGGGKIGGFLNFIPKTARSASAKWLEKPTAKVTMTYGSYDQKIASGEVGMPFKVGSHRGGFYAFFEAEDSKSFYKGIANRYKLGQIAFDMELTSKWRLEFGMQGYNNGGTQNIGWNRVTQDLVDKHEYIAGTPAVNLVRNGYNIGPADIPAGLLTQFAFTQNMGPIFRFAPDFAGKAKVFALDPATVHTVKLNFNQIMTDSPDFIDSTTFTGYFDLIHDFRPGFTFKNQTFYDTLNHQKYSSYGFGAGYRSWVIENKTSLSYEFKPVDAVKMQTVGGFAYRYSRVSAGEERDRFQVIDRRDLTIGAQPNDRFQGPYNSSGQIPFNYFQKGSYGDAGLFLLSDILAWNKLAVTLGLRYDRYTPDFSGRFDLEPMQRAASGDNAFTYNVSVGYKLPKHIEPYFTYATSTYLDLGQGGELERGQVANGTYLQDSNLYEGGVKMSGLNQKLFASAALFRQKRTAFNTQTLAPDFFRTKGLELETRAYLLKRLSLTGAFTWQKPEQLNIPFLLGIPPSALGLTPQQGFGGRFIGLADIFGRKAPFPIGGQPHYVTSVFGTYNLRRDLGFTLGSTWVSSVKAGFVSDVKLPSYAVWRGSVFYEKGPYTVNLAVNNMFDREYFTSQFLFWDVFIKPSALRALSLTWSYRFH